MVVTSFLPIPQVSGATGAAAAAASSAGASSVAPSSPATVGTSGNRLCEGCGASHSGSYASGRFCSVRCARSQGARRKWSVTPKSRRAKRERAPCEACRRMHDASFASGRFCSVNCARRAAASSKWSKTRAERSRRLDAIRPSAPVPPPPPLHPAPFVYPVQPVMHHHYGIVYPHPHDHEPPQQLPPFGAHAPTPIVYAPALAVPWAPAHAHPLAHAPLQIFAHVPRPATAMQQLARTPVTPPSPNRSPSPIRLGSNGRRTAEGDASEALLCLSHLRTSDTPPPP